MNYDFEIIVLGGGCIGSSILHELSSKGYRDIAMIDHGRRTKSATASSGGMLRVFHESPNHVELALKSQNIFNSLKQQGILTEKNSVNGHLYFFNQSRFEAFKNVQCMMEDADHPFDVLNAAQGQRRFPEYKWAKDELAVYEPNATHMDPLQFNQELISHGQLLGAQVFEDTEVRKICHYQDQYKVFSKENIFNCKFLILAGGARMLPRLKDLNLDFHLEAKPIRFFSGAKVNTGLNVPHYFDRENLEFGRLGNSSDIVLSNPTTQRLVTKTWLGEVDKIQAMDCYAPNRQGLLGEVPGHSKLILATGWGGTAFKFSLEIGRRVVSLVEEIILERKNLYV
jgi:glycine/D-amino acid oxidase-like deaminating enzyme